MEDLKDKVVVVTGASGGIGAAIALKFAEHGSKLALCGRNKDNLENVARKCEEKGLLKSKIFTVTGDLCKEEEIQHLVSEITNHYQHIDILVNNAGYLQIGGIEECTLDNFDDMYKIHIRAVVSLTQKFLPFLKVSKGVIINISSVVGIRPQANFLSYCPMKAAQDHLTRCLAVELGPHQIRVIGINSGYVNTKIFIDSGLVTNTEEENKFFDNMGTCIPLGRVGYPEEIAETVVFMASSKASFVTGCNFLVDGGYAQTVGSF